MVLEVESKNTPKMHAFGGCWCTFYEPKDFKLKKEWKTSDIKKELPLPKASPPVL